MRRSPKKKKGNYQFNLYNKVKQEWSKKVSKLVTEKGFNKVESCYFNYLVVEKTKKRDPSNVCASAIKFIEDGLQIAGVIPNDGWDNVLGIRTYWIKDKESPGIFCLMSDEPSEQNEICTEWMKHV